MRRRLANTLTWFRYLADETTAKVNAHLTWSHERLCWDSTALVNDRVVKDKKLNEKLQNLEEDGLLGM